MKIFVIRFGIYVMYLLMPKVNIYVTLTSSLSEDNWFGHENIWFSDLAMKLDNLIDLAMKNFVQRCGIYVMYMLMPKVDIYVMLTSLLSEDNWFGNENIWFSDLAMKLDNLIDLAMKSFSIRFCIHMYMLMPKLNSYMMMTSSLRKQFNFTLIFECIWNNVWFSFTLQYWLKILVESYYHCFGTILKLLFIMWIIN